MNCALFNADFNVVSRAINSKFFMPTYEYSCQKCGQNFEAFQSMRAQPFQECPKELCRLPKWGHGKVKRLLGTGAGCRNSRLVPTVANGSPAFGQYKPDPAGGFGPWALVVLGIDQGRIAELAYFLDTDRLFPMFGLPPRLDPDPKPAG